MKVFVAGGTGVLGWRAVKRLVAAGHEVTAIARSPEKAERLRGLGATPVGADLFDSAALRAAVAGHDAVLNLATHIPPSSQMLNPRAWRENDRIRTEGAANLVDAALAAGASRFVQESITFRYLDGGDRWIDAETQDIAHVAFSAANDAAEASAQRFTDAGGIGVVLRFGLFYAPDAVHTQDMVRLARLGMATVAGRPDAYQSMIHADDAAAAVVAALDAPAGIYDVVDDEPLTKRELAAVLGGQLRVPGSLSKLGGDYGGIMGASQRVSNRRFKEATGWAPAHASVRDGWPATVAQIADPAPRRLTERLVRPVLAVLALSALQLGVWATVAPRSFYDDFPTPARHWVAVDGPYNEHLVRDFGGLQLALGALLVAALLRPQRYLVRTAAVCSWLFAVPHFGYHVRNLDVYGTGDQVANVVLLGMAVVLPALLIAGTAGRSPTPSAAAGTVGAPWEPSASSSLPSSAPSPG